MSQKKLEKKPQKGYSGPGKHLSWTLENSQIITYANHSICYLFYDLSSSLTQQEREGKINVCICGPRDTVDTTTQTLQKTKYRQIG